MPVTIEVPDELAARLGALPGAHDFNDFAVAAIQEKIEFLEGADASEYEETLAALREGAADMKAGRLYTLEESRAFTDAALAEHRHRKETAR